MPETGTPVPEDLERAVLRLVRDGNGQASWHTVATRLPSLDVPLDPDPLTVLKDLETRGLVRRTLVGGGMDAWALTPAGEARLAGPGTAAGPLSAEELARFLAALRADAATSTRALLPLVDDGLRFWAVLRQALAADPAAAEAVAAAALFLPRTERGPFAREMLDDARPDVRAALFRAWTPVRKDVPGDPLPTVLEAELDELLRRGLLDPSPDVREAAATLTFLAGRGRPLLGELTANLGALEPGVRWWSILALGGATDPLSLDLLSQALAGDDLAAASAAVRALGARRDGGPAWFAALHDPRPDVRDAAVFALGTVVPELDEDQQAALAADPRPAVQEAVAAFRARTGRS